MARREESGYRTPMPVASERGGARPAMFFSRFTMRLAPDMGGQVPHSHQTPIRSPKWGQGAAWGLSTLPALSAAERSGRRPPPRIPVRKTHNLHVTAPQKCSRLLYKDSPPLNLQGSWPSVSHHHIDKLSRAPVAVQPIFTPSRHSKVVPSSNRPTASPSAHRRGQAGVPSHLLCAPPVRARVEIQEG